jgi:ammonia channel protein AmtB
MTIPGLALFYGGMVRVTNVLSTLMQCFSIVCLITIEWMIVGYSLAFSEGNAVYGNIYNIIYIHTYIQTCIHIILLLYIYIHTHTHTYIYIYIGDFKKSWLFGVSITGSHRMAPNIPLIYIYVYI